MTARVVPLTKYVGPREAADLLGITPHALRRLVRRGRVPHVRPSPRVVRFEPERLVEWRATAPEMCPSSRPERPIDGPACEGVYFVQMDGVDRIKIGSSRNIVDRVRDLNATCPRPVRLLGFVRCTDSTHHERAIHLAWDRFRRHAEWFEADPELLTWIAEVSR